TAALLALGGGIALVLGAVQAQIAPALAGGAVSAVGVLLGAVVLVPALVRLLGAAARRLGGVAGDLAVENAVRNPTRAAATGSALLVGVTLITMMSVAALSAQQGVVDHLTARYAVDAEISADPGALTPSVVDRVSRTDGVGAVVTLTSTRARIGAGAAGADQLVTGVPAEQVGRVLRSRDLTSYARVAPGTLVVASALALDLGVTEGAGTTLAGMPVRVHLEQDPPYDVLAATSDLTRAGVRQQSSSVLLRLRDGADPGPVLDRLARSLAGVDRVRVDGAAPQRAEAESVVSGVLAVVTGLLAVAVLIALLGVGNTLSLSVLERGRESALLRALGLTRSQLRTSIAIEAALLSLVGAVAGVALGIGYGYAGARALVGSLTTVPLVVPWPRLVLVLALALVAGVVAAWLPSRRAARVAPAAGLAID
ncbi:MAG: FtsX-like permease family protein, partial [Actinomycetota bacterium]|nr:FtsX-like permease family protein [Actinomycetota bacterium]